MLFLNDTMDACSDLALANTLSFVHTIFTIICIITPIFLILMASITFIRYIGKPPESSKEFKKVFVQFAAAFVIFFLPSTMDVILAFLPSGTFHLADCWNYADRVKTSVGKAVYSNGNVGTSGKTLLGNLSLLASYAKDESGGSNASVGTGKSKYGQTVPVYDDSTKAGKLLNGAMYYVGGPYVWGGGHFMANGRLPSTMEEAFLKQGGVDCSGFVRLIYKQYAGINTGGNTTSGMFRSVGKAVNGKENAKLGDIICYDNHVAIYMGDGKIIHAAGGTGPKMNKIIQGYPMDYMNIRAIRRLIDE